MTIASTSLVAGRAWAASPEPLPADFLDYLADCESKDSDWTAVASDKDRKKPVAKPPAKPAPPADATKETKP